MTLAQSPSPNAAAAPPPKKPASILRKIWRVIYWATIVAGAWGIIQMLRVAPGPLVTTSPDAARSAAQKLYVIAMLAGGSHSASGPQRITLTEEEVNSLLAQRLQVASLQGPRVGTVRDAKVTFSADRARVWALFQMAGKDLSFEMEGRLEIVDDYLRFEPTGGSLGRLPLSRITTGLVISLFMNSPMTRETFHMPGIREVRVENGEVAIEVQ